MKTATVLEHFITTIEREGWHYATVDGQEVDVPPAKYPRSVIKRAVELIRNQYQTQIYRELEQA